MSSSFQKKCERRQEKLVSELNIVYGKRKRNQKRRKENTIRNEILSSLILIAPYIFSSYLNSFTNAALKLGLPLNVVLHCQLKSLLFSFERIFFSILFPLVPLSCSHIEIVRSQYVHSMFLCTSFEAWNFFQSSSFQEPICLVSYHYQIRSTFIACSCCIICFHVIFQRKASTPAIARLISVKNARAWNSMVSYFEKQI